MHALARLAENVLVMITVTVLTVAVVCLESQNVVALTTAIVLHLQMHVNVKPVDLVTVNLVANALLANVPPLVDVVLFATVRLVKTRVHANSMVVHAIANPDATVLHVIVNLNAVAILVVTAWLVKTLAFARLVASVLVVIIVTALTVDVARIRKCVDVRLDASVWRVRILALVRLVEFVFAGIIVIVPRVDVRSCRV